MKNPASIDDDFFDLGGHSFAVRTVALIHNTLGMELSVAAVFEHSTLATLAGEIIVDLTPDQPECRPSTSGSR